jgi:hypothetical protein
LNGAVSKTVVGRLVHRGFESHPLRYRAGNACCGSGSTGKPVAMTAFGKPPAGGRESVRACRPDYSSLCRCSSIPAASGRKVAVARSCPARARCPRRRERCGCETVEHARARHPRATAYPRAPRARRLVRGTDQPKQSIKRVNESLQVVNGLKEGAGDARLARNRRVWNAPPSGAVFCELMPCRIPLRQRLVQQPRRCRHLELCRLGKGPCPNIMSSRRSARFVRNR